MEGWENWCIPRDNLHVITCTWEQAHAFTTSHAKNKKARDLCPKHSFISSTAKSSDLASCCRNSLQVEQLPRLESGLMHLARTITSFNQKFYQYEYLIPLSQNRTAPCLGSHLPSHLLSHLYGSFTMISLVFIVAYRLHKLLRVPQILQVKHRRLSKVLFPVLSIL